MAIRQIKKAPKGMGLPLELAGELSVVPIEAFKRGEGMFGPYRHALKKRLVKGAITWEVVTEAVRRYLEDGRPWMVRTRPDGEYRALLVAEVHRGSAVLYYAPNRYVKWSRAQARKTVRALRGNLDREKLHRVTQRFLDAVAGERWARWAGNRLDVSETDLGDLAAATSPAVPKDLLEDFITEIQPGLWDEFVAFCPPEQTEPAIRAAQEEVGWAGIDLPIGGAYTVDGDHPGSDGRYAALRPALSLTFLQMLYDEKGRRTRVVPV